MMEAICKRLASRPPILHLERNRNKRRHSWHEGRRDSVQQGKLAWTLYNCESTGPSNRVRGREVQGQAAASVNEALLAQESRSF